MIKMGKIGLGALSLAGLLALQACDVSVGYTEGGWYYPRHDYYPGYYYGGGGHWRGRVRHRMDYRGRRGHLSRGGHHGRHHVLLNTDSIALPSQEVMANRRAADGARLLSRDYGIRYDSAVKILQVTQSKDLSKDLKALGLKTRDVAPLAKLEIPSSQSVERVAAALGESPAKIQKVMQGYIADVKTGAVNRQ